MTAGPFRYGDVLKGRRWDPWRVMYLREAKGRETGGQMNMFVGMTVRSGTNGQKVGNITFFPASLWKRDE